MSPKIKLRNLTDPTIFLNYFSSVQIKSVVDSSIKNDILKLAHSWKQNNEIWKNAEELITHWIFKITDREFEDDELSYSSNELKTFIYDLDDSFIYTFVPDMQIAIWGNEFITDIYELNPLALSTLKYLGTQPSRYFKGIIQSIENKEIKESPSDYNDCLEYLKTIGFIFKTQVEALYKYLSKLPSWQKTLIKNQLNSSSKIDFQNLFDYIKQEEMNEINRCESMTPNFDITRFDWGDPFEGTSENSPSF